ncbi:winged helix-turn-helix transcriptional regulator [Streptomyces erythrochromogenes]|uniref:winged helix-turn-helix transcriptional regulator n=1 Tax=Streptomyces erythrochromogenes TaxID=285574 RepID=UPI0002F48073
MPTTGLPRSLTADLARVGESLEMLSPRWTVWTLMTLSDQPMRYTEIKPRLGMLQDGQLAPRLARLTADGLVERRQEHVRHVNYRLSARGRALTGVIAALASYGDSHLDKETKPNRKTGELEVERIPPAQNAEDVLTLITPKHATPLLWALRSEGRASGRDLAAMVIPAGNAALLYSPLRQLVADGLVERLGHSDYQLSSQGMELAPVFRSLSAWASGRRAHAEHPLWAERSAPDQQLPAGRWAANRSHPVAAPPTTTVHPGHLFSHAQPARPAAAGSSMGGRAR